MKTRTAMVEQMRSWLGWSEANGKYKKIIDIYNAHTPLPIGYRVQYTDEWCATTVSAAAISLGYTDIIPVECSCARMIKKAQAMGIWVESDDYTPFPGDIIMYDWQDSGSGDNTGWPDHVGVVESCQGGFLGVIEGNNGECVARRVIKVNARYIRGYICPKYGKEASAPAAPSKKKKWTGRITAEYLNVRKGPAVTYPNILAYPVLEKGTEVAVCDEIAGWLYIRYKKRYGYCSAKYVERV